MCGFSGFISTSLSLSDSKNILNSMGRVLVPRGPDEEGFWISGDGSIGLVHRRLAVIDPGPGGRQPMQSRSGRYLLVFNGEIYNHQMLRVELESAGVNFHTKSDTEVLLAALEHWGIKRALQRSLGMFAFALWDNKHRKLSLARDRFGEKPLYYGWQGRSFIFGSTVHALREHSDWKGEIDKEALRLLLRYDYIPAPHSIYQGIRKLLPGTWLELEQKNGDWRECQDTYWSALTAADTARVSPFGGSFEDAANMTEALMRNTLKGQMMADVPLGAFLSGGIDSTAIVALMQSENRQSVRTFTVGFEDPDYDESKFAEEIAKRLGTLHTTCMFNHTDVLDLIGSLPKIYDEPFADASQLPTALVSKVARHEVTVALSGDGGDEIFGGYNRYIWGENLRGNLERLPLSVRKIAASGIRNISPLVWDNLFRLLPATRRPKLAGEKLHKLANLMSAQNSREIYDKITTFWADGLPIMKSKQSEGRLDDAVWQWGSSFTERMMLADTISYLPDDILVKVDRAAMFVGLETRAPFLDHRLFELVWSLPLSYRLRNNKGKSLLREILYRYIPKEFVERPKSGFALPLGTYLRGPLRDWAESLLNRERLLQEGYFDADKIQDVWRQHLSGRFNRQYDLWSVLMFQAWLDD